MENIAEAFRSLVRSVRVRNRGRAVSSAFLAILIALLLVQTQWIFLRPGLVVLLVVQAAIPLTLLYQNRKISRAIATLENLDPDETEINGWFVDQKRFTKRLALVENLGRFAGFALLAYGFWISTHIVWLALALGFVYPTVIYFGITRTNQRRARKELEKQRQQQLMRVQSKRAG